MEENNNNNNEKPIIEVKKVDENTSNTNQNVNSNFNNNANTGNTTFQATTNTKNSKKDFHFGRTIAVPFVSGVLGATLVVGTCLGVPEIRTTILGTTSTQSTASTSSQIENSTNSSVSSSSKLVSLADYSETGIAVASKVLPSIVGITVQYSVNSTMFYTNSNSTTNGTIATASGSGIIMSEDGYILTNNHIVNSTSTSSYYSLGEATKITVKLYNDDTEYEAKIVGTDEETDLAVVKIEKTGLTAAEIADSDEVQVGEFAMAVGNPLGLESSVSAGMISATNRKITSDGKTYTLIQTDAAINSGNSGGALVNAEGKVIGINTLKLTGTSVEGMGFAIPINSAIDIYEQLVEFNTVKRPYLGITGINLTEATAKANNLVVGIYVKSVEDFSAAQKADIRNGDVIIAADGQTVTTMDEFNEIKNKHSIGDTMTITINRNGSEKEITVTLQEQPSE